MYGSMRGKGEGSVYLQYKTALISIPLFQIDVRLSISNNNHRYNQTLGEASCPRVRFSV
jgi:hypothetical protein